MLKNRRALVTGSTSGIGLAIARALAAEGAEVILNGLGDPAEIATLCEELGASYNGANLMDPQAIAGMMAAIGAVDILVNNAGMQHVSPVEDFPPEKWDAIIALNLTAAFHTTRLAVPGMKAKGWGRIITSATSGVIAPIPNLGLSNALRSALVGWSKTLAAEVAKDGVTSNIVLPGRIATPRIAFLDAKKAEREGREISQVEAESLRAIPAGRYGDPQEYADVVAFLASTRASYVTGSMIRIDGGYIANV